MRYSIASQALCGAITVSTMAGSVMAVPCTHSHNHSKLHKHAHKHAHHVDISNFKSFPTADPRVFFDKSDEAVREFFNVGMFDDGPMDKAGKWTDRPVALLKNVGDQMELHFEQIREHFEEFEEKIEDHFEDLAEEAKDRQEAAAKQRLDVVKAKHEMLAKWKDQVKSHLGAHKASQWFPDFTEIFGGKLPVWQHQEGPNQPEETEQPVQSTQIPTTVETPRSVPQSTQTPTTTVVSSTVTQSTQIPTTTTASSTVITQSTQTPTTTAVSSSTVTQSTQIPTTSAVSSSSQTQAPTSSSSSSTQTNEPTKAPETRTCDPSNSNVRFEWDNYSRSDRTAFVKAIKCLQQKPSGGSQFAGSTSRYEDLVSVHRGMTANVHQTSTFLVWHRYFVWVFEQLLRNECGFDRALPWWDETKHAGNFAGSDIFTDEWFGHLPKISADGRGTCIESGEFASTTLHVGPGMKNEKHCLSRALDETSTAQCSKQFTNSCLSMKTYDEFRDCFELGPHGYGHNGIGAVMAEVSASVGDPIFFMHHLFVDHTFRIWQNANPQRRTTISGCADNASPCTTITLDTVLSSNGLAPDLAVRDVLDTLSGTVCYRYNY